jgi:hypothetical protein
LWSRLALDIGLAVAVGSHDDDGDVGPVGPRPADGQLRFGLGLRWGLP